MCWALLPAVRAWGGLSTQSLLWRAGGQLSLLTTSQVTRHLASWSPPLVMSRHLDAACGLTEELVLVASGPQAWRHKCRAPLLIKCPSCRCHPGGISASLPGVRQAPSEGEGPHEHGGGSLVHFPGELHARSSEPRPRHL